MVRSRVFIWLIVFVYSILFIDDTPILGEKLRVILSLIFRLASYKSSTISPAQFLTSASWTGVLNYAFVISSIVSFVSFWVATVFLLWHYSKRIGPVKYWLMLSIPLFYFTSQFLPYFLDLFSSFRESDPILFGIIYTVIFTEQTCRRYSFWYCFLDRSKKPPS